MSGLKDKFYKEINKWNWLFVVLTSTYALFYSVQNDDYFLFYVPIVIYLWFHSRYNRHKM